MNVSRQVVCLSKQHGVNSFKDDDVFSLLLTGKQRTVLCDLLHYTSAGR